MLEMSNREAIIELKGLSIGYRGKHRVNFVAKNMCASLYGGELTAVLGANGIGKSTLIRTITRAQEALDGEIHLMGKTLSSYAPAELATLMSVVLTDKVDIKSTSVFDLIGMGRAPYTGFWGALKSEDKEIIEECLELVNITKLRDRMVNTLSDGERQKVMIAKALAQQTPIILLDEPTAFLDFPSKVETMQLLLKLARELGKTILLSTHDLDLALQIADKIWIMDSSSELHVGVPEDLAIDGVLSKFFQRKGISFDKVSGLFKVNYNINSFANIRGEGFRYNMVCKALLRCGIAVDSSNQELIIDVKESESANEIEINVVDNRQDKIDSKRENEQDNKNKIEFNSYSVKSIEELLENIL